MPHPSSALIAAGRHGLIALALAAPAFAAQAVSYFTWQAVELPASTGASCGNGSPYRFFVNRTPLSNKTVVIYEGGGACWDQASCKGNGPLSASNPNGIPANYMSSIEHKLATPFQARVHPLQSVQTQSWNIVFVPYCTGDVHTGNAVAVYSDADAANPLTYAHKGSINTEAMAGWLKATLPRPDHLLVTGYSAGGAGASANYAVLRTVLDPKKSALLADSGPLFPAPRSGSLAQYPSKPLQEKIRVTWGLDRADGLLGKMNARYPGVLDADDLGSLTTGLGKAFPQDRLGFATQQEDQVYAGFSYAKFYPEIAAMAGDAQKQALNEKWRVDVGNWVARMNTQPNVGYYIPNGRTLMQAHCLTVVTFGGTAIKEANWRSVGQFVDNLIDGKGQPIRAIETKRIIQSTLPLGLDSLLGIE